MSRDWDTVPLHIMRANGDVTLCGLKVREGIHAYRIGTPPPTRPWNRPCKRCEKIQQAKDSVST